MSLTLDNPKIGIKLFIGNNKFNTKLVNNSNYIKVFNLTSIKSNLNFNNDYFQSNEIINIISTLRSEEQ